jgi:mono/diheme cytochrome c family protein
VRRLVPLLAFLVLAAGCSTSKPGEKVVSPLPSGPVSGVTTQATVAVPAQYKDGDPTAGPNLDQAQPALSLAVTRVTKGAGAMPSFKGQLTDKQIADVTAYVVKATGGNANG